MMKNFNAVIFKKMSKSIKLMENGKTDTKNWNKGKAALVIIIDDLCERWEELYLLTKELDEKIKVLSKID